MSHFLVRKVAVLGAGVMGAQIAAQCANANVPVLLFDLPAKEGDPNAVVRKAIEGLKKLNPAPLAHPDRIAAIEPANYAQDLPRLAECDLVIEAIAERMDWKHDLYKKVASHLGPNTVFATNTSGLSITALSEGFDADLKARFCGVHFFNPPRYMHLVELIPTTATRPEILDGLETFLTTTLGKGVVRALDTPNFIANRVGVFGMLAVMAEAEKFGLSYDIVDDLTGSKLGRAKSGTFRTADVVGLDTLGHVIQTMRDQLKDDPFAALYGVAPVLEQLVQQGALGQKSGAGFYKKVGKDILRLDPGSGQYVAAGQSADPLIGRILKKPVAERLKLLRESTHPQAQFLWAIFRDMFHYAAVHLASIAETARDVDFALRWGFGWKEGPFETWQAAGWQTVAHWVQEDIDRGQALSAAPLPDWVLDGRSGVHSAQGSYAPRSHTFKPRPDLGVYQRQTLRAPLLGEENPALGKTVWENAGLRVWTLDDKVLIASLQTKMHVIGPDVTVGLMQAVDLAEADYEGLVIWSPDEPFSAGADLQAILPLFMTGGIDAVAPEIARFQAVMQRLRYAQVPTVAAVAGLALGGGCELMLHCTRHVAHLESYIGLVEVGVGLIPGAGGLAYGARQAALEQSKGGNEAPLLPFLTKYIMNAGTAAVSKSALEAQQMGYLLDSDRIVMHAYEVLSVALREARTLFASGYRAPLPARIRVAGRTGIANVMAQLVGMKEGGFISAHDLHLGQTIAQVMCGGDIEPGSIVDEAWLMKLERDAFMRLLGHPKTQERIMGMMQTGKPVRN